MRKKTQYMEKKSRENVYSVPLPIILLIVKLSTWLSKNENMELNLRENKFISTEKARLGGKFFKANLSC